MIIIEPINFRQSPLQSNHNFSLGLILLKNVNKSIIYKIIGPTIEAVLMSL